VRQLFIEVPTGRADELTDILERHEVLAIWRVDMEYEDSETQLVIMHTSNGCVDDVLNDLREIDGTKVTFNPDDMLVFTPPYTETTTEVIDLDRRSPVEVYLDGLQSLGAWQGYLSYALGAAVVAWIAMFTGSIVPLIAAVLIAPFGGPAMNIALATARGSTDLLSESLSRYAVGLLAAIAVCALLSLVLQQSEVTNLMLGSTQVSSVSFLLPLVTGAIGAHNLFQSEGSSLVPGTAVGALVAASLMPPAAAIGMAISAGQLNLVDNGIFLLLLQLVAINLGGTVVFRLYGIKVEDSRYEHGKKWLLPAAVAVSAVVMAGLLVWQYGQPQYMHSASRAQRVAADIRETVNAYEEAEVLSIDVNLTSENNTSPNTLLAVVYVERTEDAFRSSALIEADLRSQIETINQEYPYANVALALYVLD
jgi:uncharacterized membrane protein